MNKFDPTVMSSRLPSKCRVPLIPTACARRISEAGQDELIAAAEQTSTRPRLTQGNVRNFVRNATQLIADLEASKIRFNECAAAHPVQLLNSMREAAQLKLVGEDIKFANLEGLQDGPIGDDGLQVSRIIAQ